jgi:hypothetical protein
MAVWLGTPGYDFGDFATRNPYTLSFSADSHELSLVLEGGLSTRALTSSRNERIT